MAVSFGDDWFEEQVKQRSASESDYTDKYGTAANTISPLQAALFSLTSLGRQGAALPVIRESLPRTPKGAAAMDAYTESPTPTPFNVFGGYLPQSPSPMDIPGLTQRQTPPEKAPRGPGGPSISDVFAPLFDALDQQRRNAESRYTSNVGQIQNIYGQLIGARSADVDSIEKAYGRLQEAAASRGEATISGMQEREATRRSQADAMQQSMGLEGMPSSAATDVAAQASQAAQDVEALNQANWSGMLSAMGATSQDIARSDITSYGYRQGEDIATLQAAKENYLQDVAQKEFETKFQEQQMKFEAAQAAAAARAKAEAEALRAQQQAEEQQYDRTMDFLGAVDPLTSVVGRFSQAGFPDFNGQNVIAAFNDWAIQSPAAQNTMTPVGQVIADAERYLTGKVSPTELDAIRTAIYNIYK